MDVDKIDTDKMSDDEIREDIKAKLSKTVLRLDRIIIVCNSIPERFEILMNEKIWEIFSKEITWFFAISVGTLLWFLSNFDKFKLPDGSMPHKSIYMLSLILLGLSSLLLAAIQGILYFYQHKTIIDYNRYIISFNLYMRSVNDFKNNLNDMLKQVDSTSFKELEQIVSKSEDYLKSAETFADNWDKSLDLFANSFNNLRKISWSEYIIIPPVIFYILGVISISVYILMFMSEHV